MQTKQVNIRDVKPGDTVHHNGQMRTVCANNITHCDFMGRKLFGDSYALGTRPVTLVIIEAAKCKS